MIVADKDKPSIEDALLHAGVKGMHWGVRKQEDVSGSTPTLKSKTDISKARAAKSEELSLKYGPGSLSGKPQKINPNQKDQRGFHLTPTEKKVAIVGGVAAVSVLAVYGYKKFGLNSGNKILPKALSPHDIESFIVQDSLDHRSLSNMYSMNDVKKLSREPINLPKGTILKRISMDMESDIHPDGFFAAYRDDDVTRYKAILPTYWTKWNMPGKDVNRGFIVKLKSKVDIKAASPRETYDVFEGLLSKDPEFAKTFAGYSPPNKDVGVWARNAFQRFTTNITIDPTGEVTQKYFSELKKRGYNAVVDMNDAGSISKSPLRVFDGKQFSIDGHEMLTRESISAAQKTIFDAINAGLHSGGR